MSPLESFFSRVKPIYGGAGYESTLVEKCPNDSESTHLDDKGVESGVEEIKILVVTKLPLWISRNSIMIIAPYLNAFL